MYVPEGYGTVFPYMVVEHAANFVEFLKSAFEAKEVGRKPASNDLCCPASFVPLCLCVFVFDVQVSKMLNSYEKCKSHMVHEQRTMSLVRKMSHVSIAH